MNSPTDTISFRYRFLLLAGRTREFFILLDKKTLNLIQNANSPRPEWTRLSSNKCPNCPLNEKENPYCPAALSLAEPIETFKSDLSYEEADVELTTPDRVYRKTTSLQNAISSLFGIYMTTSGCPVLAKLKPLVRLHLPFASLEETTYRTIAIYLMAQYFLYKRGQTPDWDLKDLPSIFEDIRIVNESFRKRISGVQIEEASLNAIFRLDYFARFTSITLLDKGLSSLEPWFEPYFHEI